MSFGFFATGTAQTTSDSPSTRTVTVPASVVAGQAMFLWAGGRSTLDTIDFSAPGGGWREVGTILRTDATGISGSGTRPHGALRMWWRVANAGDASSTVTVTGTDHYEFRIGLFVYESDAAEWPRIVSGPQDDTTGTSHATTYTPPAFTATETATCVTTASLFPDIAGSISNSTLASFTVEEQFNAGSSNEPPLVVADKTVTAGSITLPTWSANDRPWVSKTFALAAQIFGTTECFTVGASAESGVSLVYVSGYPDIEVDFTDGFLPSGLPAGSTLVTAWEATVTITADMTGNPAWFATVDPTITTPIAGTWSGMAGSIVTDEGIDYWQADDWGDGETATIRFEFDTPTALDAFVASFTALSGTYTVDPWCIEYVPPSGGWKLGWL